MTFTGNGAGAFLEPKPLKTVVSMQPEVGRQGGAPASNVFIDFQ